MVFEKRIGRQVAQAGRALKFLFAIVARAVAKSYFADNEEVVGSNPTLPSPKKNMERVVKLVDTPV